MIKTFRGENLIMLFGNMWLKRLLKNESSLVKHHKLLEKKEKIFKIENQESKAISCRLKDEECCRLGKFNISENLEKFFGKLL